MSLLDGTRIQNTALPKIVKKPAKSNKLTEIINNIQWNLDQNLSKFREDYEVMWKREDLSKFLEKCHEVVAIDTETTGVEIYDKLVGVSVYSEGQKAIYIPVHHIDPITEEKVDNLCDNDTLNWFISELNNHRLVYHNAAFDIRVLQLATGIAINYPYWDTLVGAHLFTFDTNNRGLKAQYTKYIADKDDAKFTKFSDLFEGITLDKLPIKLVYIYAARDAYMTYELYKFQEKLFNNEFSELRDVLAIELKLTKITADMKINGVHFNKDTCDYLSGALHVELDNAENHLRETIATHVGIAFNVNRYDPNSNKQTKELLFKYMKLPLPRGITYAKASVDEEMLKYLKNDVASALLVYRSLFKQLTTYVDNIRNKFVGTDNKVHANFNSFGAATGRFSSSNPNMQNITASYESPSGKKYSIRGIFGADEGNVWIGADYSSQEIRVAAAISGDKNLKKAFEEGYDIHSFMASLAFHREYEDCLEFYTVNTGKHLLGGDGVHLDEAKFYLLDANNERITNKEGKAFRRRAKSVTFASAYGSTEHGIANDLGCSVDEAKDIIDAYYNAFPAIKDGINKAQKYAIRHGYVKTLLNRRREIKSIQDGELIIKLADGCCYDFDPDLEVEDNNYGIPIEIVDEICEKYKRASYKEKANIIEQYKKSGILLIDNTSAYNNALRQCWNSVIQGTSADMTKLALIYIYEDKRLRDIGAKIVLTIHDENIIEVKEEHKDYAAKCLKECMLNAAKHIVDIPFNSDIEFYTSWK